MEIKQLEALSHWTEKYKVVPSINQKLWLSNIAAVAAPSACSYSECSAPNTVKTRRNASHRVCKQTESRSQCKLASKLRCWHKDVCCLCRLNDDTARGRAKGEPERKQEQLRLELHLEP